MFRDAGVPALKPTEAAKPSGTISTVLGTHNTFRSPRTCFHFNFFKSEENNEYDNNEYIIINPGWIMFVFILMQW